MNKNRWGVVIILFLMQFSLLADNAGKDNVDIKTKVLSRSLFFPGLGQLYEKQYVKAAFFASSEIFCIIQAFIQNKKGDDNYSLYRSANNADDVLKFRSLTDKYDKRRNAYLLVGAGIWIANMIDIFIHCKKKYTKKNTLSVQPEINHEKKQISLAWRYSF